MKNVMYAAVILLCITLSVCAIALTIHFKKPLAKVTRPKMEVQFRVSNPMETPYYRWELEKEDRTEAKRRNIITEF